MKDRTVHIKADVRLKQLTKVLQDFLTEKAMQKEFDLYEKAWLKKYTCDFCSKPCLEDHCVTRGCNG